MWYSTNGAYWSTLASADGVVDYDPGAVINVLLSTSTGIFAAGTWANGDRTSAALWYSPDGIHWRAVSPGAGSFGGPGDRAITSLVDMSANGNNSASGAGPDELLAVGGIRAGATWEPASWISPDGFSWSPTSESFPLDNEPAGSPGALAYAASMAGGTLYAVGGSPGRQRLWTSQQGLSWDEVPLPAGAARDPGWHLGLVASDGRTTVLADNLPGQPFVLVHQGAGWSQPSAQGRFGRPLAMAVPTSLVNDNGSLFLSVDIARPGLRLGRGTNSVTILTSADGQTWRRTGTRSLNGDLVNQLMAAPTGLLAVGAALAPGAGPVGPGIPAASAGPAGDGTGWTGAFARLSTDSGASWAHEAIGPPSAGTGAGTGPAASASASSAASVVASVAVAAGRLGDVQYVVGRAGTAAVAWQSVAGSSWTGPRPLDVSPQLAAETVVATCGSGSSAIAVGSMSTPRYGQRPAAWSTTDGSSWTTSVFLPAPPPGSFTSVDGCLSTGNGFIAYGSTSTSRQASQPVLWSSGDGTTWQQLSTTFTGVSRARLRAPESAPLDEVSTGTTNWLGLSGGDDLPTQRWPAPVGGAAGLAGTIPGLWASGDAGNSWLQLDTSVPPFTGVYFAQADQVAYLGPQPVVAGTVDGRLALWAGALQAAVPGT